MTDKERTRAAAVESILGIVMLVGGIILTMDGGVAGAIGLALIVFGVTGVAHAVFLGLGVMQLPGEQEDSHRKHDDLRRRRPRR